MLFASIFCQQKKLNFSTKIFQVKKIPSDAFLCGKKTPHDYAKCLRVHVFFFICECTMFEHYSISLIKSYSIK